MAATFTDDLLRLSTDAFLRRAFVALLGRAPDADNLNNYSARLAEGASRAEIWNEIATQEPAAAAKQRSVTLAEVLSLEGADFVRAAYRHVLGREADADGLIQYLSRIASGTPKDQVLADLRSDAEGQAHGEKLEGLDALVRTVQARSGATPADSEPHSLEELMALNGTPFVMAAYRMFLRRDADPEGLTRYSSLLLQGYSRTHVVRALYESSEAREKGVSVPALDKRLRAYARAQEPDWKGWYWRQVRGVESDLPRDRELRALLAHIGKR